MSRVQQAGGQGRRVAEFLAIAGVSAAVDLGTKAWAVAALADVPGQTKVVAAPWLDVVLRYNRGTAFSAIFDLGETIRVVLGVASLAIVVALLLWARRPETSTLERWSAGILAGGAIGNGWDRVFREAPGGGTGVVDFVKINYPWGGSWPAFNVADALLVVGVGLLLIAWRGGSAAQAE